MAEPPEGAEVAAAVQRVFRDGLLSGRSAFVPEREAWTERTATDTYASASWTTRTSPRTRSWPSCAAGSTGRNLLPPLP